MTDIPSTGKLAQAQDAAKPLNLGDATIRASQAAPTNSPSTSVTIASKGGDITGNAQTVAQAKSVQDRASAVQSVRASVGDDLDSAVSWLGHYVGHPLGQALSDASAYLNKPMQTVQHEYRYLRDVEAKHGIVAGVGEGLGVAAGATLGGIATGGAGGAVLGGEAAARLEGQFLYHTSWTRTQNPAYKDPYTGGVISMGQTFARAVGAKGTGAYKPIADVITGIGTLLLTPVGHVGGVVGDVRSPEGAGGQLKKVWGGTGLKTPEDIERAYQQYPSVRKAFTDISKMTAGEISTHYQKFLPISKDLEMAQTPQEVMDVFKRVVTTSKLNTTDTLPTQTFMRAGFQKVRDAAGNYGGPLSTNFLVGPARWSRRLTNLPGQSFDEVAKSLSNEIDPFSDQNAKDVQSMVRYSQDQRTSEMVATNYTWASPADRVKVYRNAIVDMWAAMAHFEPAEDYEDLSDWEETIDPTFRKALVNRLDELTGGATPGQAGSFGVSPAGKELGEFYTETTQRYFRGPLVEGQHAKLGVPAFSESKRIGAMLKGGNAYLGRADDFLFHRVVAPYVKPLELLSGGYPVRMAAAEIIPNILRQGLMKTVKGAFYSTQGKLGYMADGDEKDFAAWLSKVFKKIPQNQTHADDSAAFYALSSGHGAPRAVSADEDTARLYTDGEKATHAMRAMLGRTPRSDLKTSKTFGILESTKDRNFLTAWQDGIHEAGNSKLSQVAASKYRQEIRKGTEEDLAVHRSGKAVADYIKNTMDPLERESFPGHHHFSGPNPPNGMTPDDNWGMNVAQNVRGLLGKNANDTIAKAIEDGRRPHINELTKIPEDERPEVVKGRHLITNGSTRSMSRIFNYGFRHIMAPMINGLSRDPAYMTEYLKQMDMLRPSIENGTRDYDEAVNLAADRAANKTARFVHNVHTRTQWTETLRNWAPFFFAQEQAYKRAGRLLATTPGAFRRYQLMINAAGHYAAEMKTSKGTKYFAIPGSGIMGKYVPGLMQHLGVPLAGVGMDSFGGSISGTNVIFPMSTGFKPDTGPLAVLSAKSLAALFPESKPALSKVVDATTLSSPLWKMLVPNTFAQRMLTVGLATHTRAFMDSMMQTMQALDYKQAEAMQKWEKAGSKGNPPSLFPTQQQWQTPTAKQAFVTKVRNLTRIIYAGKALTGFATVIDPHVKVETFGLSADLQAEIKKQGSVSKGITAFISKNPNATPYTVMSTTTTIRKETTATPDIRSLPSGPQAMTWINAHKTLQKKYPQASTWLMPQFKGTAYTSAVYNEQMAQHLRTKLSATTFAKALYIAAGDQTYYAAEKTFEADLKVVTGTKPKTNALYTEWTKYQQSLKAASPIWAAAFGNKGRTTLARDSINQLLAMRAAGDVPKDAQATAVMTMLDQYEKAEAAFFQAKTAKDYESAQSAVKNAWYNYVTQIADNHPELAGVARAVFQYGLGQVPPPSGITKG